MKATWKSKYFYGNEVSEYGQQNGYVDYRTLAKCGDMVLCNDITKLFYYNLNGEYYEPNQVNGWVDNSEEIEFLEEKRDAIEDRLIELANNDLEDSNEYRTLDKDFENINGQIEELQDEQDNDKEIFQYYIIDDRLAEILKEWTNEIVYYIDSLGVYVWGITHWGTSWDYVLTNIKIKLDGGEDD